MTSDSWSLLHGWYGGGPSITRHAVMEGLAHNTKRPRVMLYPWKLQVCWGGKPNEVKTVEAEKHVSWLGRGEGRRQNLVVEGRCAGCWYHTRGSWDVNTLHCASMLAAGMCEPACASKPPPDSRLCVLCALVSCSHSP